MNRLAALGALVLVIAAAAAVALAGSPVASAAVTPGVKPDFVLSPNQPAIRRDYTSLLINDLTPALDGNTTFTDAFPPRITPDQCRTPAFDLVCDVYRIKLNRNPAKDALNQVVVEARWDGIQLPDLALVAAGLGLGYLPDIDMFLYANPTHYMPLDAVGGRSVTIPERMSWEAKQDTYDVIVRAGTGIATGYELAVYMSDEVATGKPFELLEQPDKPGSAAPPDASGPSPQSDFPNIALAPPPLAFAPIDSDSQISNIGLGTQEQFAADAIDLGTSARRVAAQAEPPSTLALIVAMILFPAAAAIGGFLVLQRRRNAFPA